MTGRLGVTDQLELELKVPYVHRDDALFATVATTEGQQEFDISRDISSNGLGDIEAALHYQLNSGKRLALLRGQPALQIDDRRRPRHPP
ncbi:hypothetical protein DSL92_04885 [Billgrantia gudaonensis]|uniref:Uncharacterized protein n=1 Tax=Billgrantia gudaonensis TaxID=376427 RepID=A0A3S0Q191_9GAMM|nr:hypothetical protein DSL92_04885 [Halomonas gudaonensis]